MDKLSRLGATNSLYIAKTVAAQRQTQTFIDLKSTTTQKAAERLSIF
jgi:hypothetical protein